MNDQTQTLTPMQKAVLALKSLRARNEALEDAAHAPIAIVGIGCRYPAEATGPDGFWQAVAAGRDGAREVPADRWDIDAVYDPTPGAPGKMYVRKSCFIDGVDRFDPLFFRISPREALGIDPQQRLLLEVAWEALEDAGIAAPGLVGSRTGVFLGISTNDYSALLSRTAHGSGSNASAGAGNAASVASGRLSYTFGFQGPCFAVDTACSSSLVAAHLAVQSLRGRECNLALVAGVNLMLAPDITINFCQGRMLSPDGRCKTFDEGADGYVRGEGCGVLVLKRLADAEADGDRVIAVIRGSAINQDGRSAGLTAPNGLAQEAVIRQALANARLAPEAVDYIEAHGTGTALGDPIEMQALKSVFAERDRPLFVGSVKTNIGHTEAAAGVAGLIKAALMLRHQAIPRSLHFDRLNPHIDLAGVDFRVPTSHLAGPVAHVGVSSFGFSGTNVHVVLEAAGPQNAGPAEPAAAPRLLISARTADALQAQIARYRDYLAATPDAFADICHTAAVGRARLPWWVCVASAAELDRAEPQNGPAPTLPPSAGRRVALPTYAFQRERYWAIDTAASGVAAPHTAEPGPAVLPRGGHPLLGRRLVLPLSTEMRWEAAVASGLAPLGFLADHQVAGRPVLPGAAYLVMALAAFPGQTVCDLRLSAPYVVPVEADRLMHTIADGRGGFRIVSTTAEGDDAVVHAAGRVEPAPAVLPALDAVEGRSVPAEIVYDGMARQGVRHGPGLRLLGPVIRRDGAAEAVLNDPPAGFTLHPGTLDAALSLVAASLPEVDDEVLVPARIGRVTALRQPAGRLTARCTAERSGDRVSATVEISDAAGPFLRVDDLVFKAAASAGVHGFYQRVWRDQPLVEGAAAPRAFPGAAELIAPLAIEAERLGLANGMAAYAAAGTAMEALATLYIRAGLAALGFAPVPGQLLTAASLAEALGIADRHRRLFRRLLDVLCEDGVLRAQGRRWQVVAAPAAAEGIAELAARLAADHPAMAGEIAVLSRCGEALAGVLRGEIDPLALLFPKEGAGAGAFYDGSGYARTVNGLIRAAGERLAASLPPGRGVTVVEVGAGTGGATGALRGAIAGRPHRYVFTDVSPAFLGEAQRRFGGAGLVTRLLDIEQDPAGQGFVPGQADIVLAANVLHATADLARSLGHIHDLLAPGGMLVLVESTSPRRWVDIVFGLTEGWWRFTDTDLRPAHPLLDQAAWHKLLTRVGFEPGIDARSEIIVARKAPDAAVAQRGAWHVANAGLGSAIAAAGGRLVAADEAEHWVELMPAAAADLASQAQLMAGLAALAQRLGDHPRSPRLTLVAGSGPDHAGLSGFVRSLAMEQPALRPRLIVADAVSDDLAAEILAAPDEEEVRLAGGRRAVMRLAPAGGVPGAAETAAAPIAGTWLITGGFGGLGLAIARWLAGQGAARLVLVGRRPPAELPDLGIPVEAVAGDAADEAMLAGVLDGISDLQGVVHAAGVLANTMAATLNEVTINRVLRPKIGGAVALDRLTRGRDLRHFILFASAAGILGSARQSNHAFASAFLDGLAAARRAEGLPALSLDWGVWSEIGAAARQGFDVQAEQLGLGIIAPDRGIAAFAAALGLRKPAQLLVLPAIDWTAFTANFDGEAPRLYAEVAEAAPEAPQPIAPAAPAAAPAVRDIDLGAELGRIVAAVFNLTGPVDPKLPLYEYGLDSLVAVEIKNRAEKQFGVQIAVRDLIEGASIQALVAKLGLAAPAVEMPAAPAVAAPRAIRPDLAGRHLPFALTEMQQAYWFGRRSDLELGNVGCYLYTEFDSRILDVARVEQAWNRLIRRHDMLRVVIEADGTQRILPEVPYYKFQVVDLRGQDAGPELDRLRRSLAQRVVEPDVWPLFDVRVTLFDDVARIHTGFDLIALDAASIFALRVEWGQLYDDLAADLPPIGLSFRDYVTEEMAFRETEAWRGAERYWAQRAGTLPGGPDLPLAADPAAQGRPRFRRHRVVVAPPAAAALRREAQARGLTLSSLLAAAYADTLAAWSRNDRFCLNVTSFNRPALHADIASLVGDFTSTILLEVDATAPRFADRAVTLARQLSADLDHAAVSGIHVQRLMNSAQGGGLRTIPVVFTSALGFRRAGAAAVTTSSTGWDRLGTTVYNVSSTPQVWVDQQITEEDGSLFCNWDAVEGLFPDGVIEQMVEAYRRLLDELAEGSAWDRPVAAALPALSRTGLVPVAADRLLHAGIVAQAALTPDRVAVIAADGVLDYRTLDAASDHLAATLLRWLGGVEAARDRLVAICFAKGWRQVVAALGILKAGAAYLPVDPALPAERRRHLIAQGEALVLDDPATLDAALAAARGGPARPDLPAVEDPSRLAYVIYTSGSTGLPKGVMIEHRAAWATVAEINRRWQVGPQDRVLGLSALNFDLSVYDIFGPLSVGGALVLPPPEAARDPGVWGALLAEHGVTLWNTVPALMAMQVEYGLPPDHRLRLVMMSGDWLPVDLVGRLRQAAPRALQVSLGGATEAAIWSNAHEIGDLDPAWPSIPYGTPLAGHDLHVVNRRGEPCPDWAIGEIEISGQGLARGYWRDAARTAERFRTDALTGERRYRTGDLGRFRPYATNDAGLATPIEFLGREDFQVKIQGHRIELGEIEAALADQPGVVEAVAITAAGDRADTRTLHAFVVPSAPMVADDFASIGAAAQAAADATAAAGSPERIDDETFAALSGRLADNAAAAAASAVSALAGGMADRATLIARHGVVPRYADWLDRMLPEVARIGIGTRPRPFAEIDRVNRLGFGEASLGLLDTTVARLADLLTEREHAAAIYLSDQTPEIYGKLFATPNAIVGAAVAAAAAGRPSLSILEVGGGLATTLAAILPTLPGGRVRYRFTDVSPHMVTRARALFGAHDWFSAGLLDLDDLPEPAERYDLIIATSALHVAADVRHSLAGLARHLAPGGLLVLAEQTRFFSWFDLNMGLQAGFDGRSDRSLRPAHPLLSRSVWTDLLAEVGFDEVALPHVADSLADRLGFDVLIARRPVAAVAPVDGDTLRARLADRLPAYMVPQSIIPIGRLPLTGNGKVDRTALGAMVAAHQAGAAAGELSALERDVAVVVAELLQRDDCDPDRSLFDLGATSLTLVGIQRRLSQRFGRAIGLQALFERPTIRHMARELNGARAGTGALVGFDTRSAGQDARPRLVMMPGVFALPFYLRDLAAAVSAEVAMLSVQLPGMFGDEAPLDTVEAQADYALRELRRAQPQGPYLIGGHSYGGCIAIEVARRLRAMGEEVPLLVLGDTVRTTTALSALQTDEVAYTAMTRGLYALYGRAIPTPYEAIAGLPPREGFDRAVAEMTARNVFGPIALPIDRMVAMFKANFRALGAYRPAPLPGDLTVIRTEGGFPVEFHDYEPEDAIKDPALGWTGLVDGAIEVRRMPGDHMSILDAANLPVMADILMELVRKAMAT